jgi:hypothetical protein
MITESLGAISFAAISQSGSGGDLVAAVTGYKIRVLALFMTNVTASGTAKFQSAGSSDLTGAMSFPANGQLVLPFSGAGLFETAAGAKLNLVLSSAGQVSGGLVYQSIASPPLP